MPDWRSMKPFKQAIESLEQEHAAALHARDNPVAAKRDEEDIWKNAYKDASDTLLRQAAFLLMLEKAGGNINEAARRLDTTSSTSEKWRASSHAFRIADGQVRAGKTETWKTREPYAEVIGKLQISDGVVPQFISDQQKTFAGKVNGLGKKILEAKTRREWAELVSQIPGAPGMAKA